MFEICWRKFASELSEHVRIHMRIRGRIAATAVHSGSELTERVGGCEVVHLGCRKWGCNKWGFKECLAALPGNRPKSAFFALFLPFSPFSGVCQEHLGNPENGKKGLFLRYPQICLSPHLLNPHLRHSNVCLFWPFGASLAGRVPSLSDIGVHSLGHMLGND